MSKQRITQYAGLAASENSVRRSQRSTAVSPDANTSVSSLVNLYALAER